MKKAFAVFALAVSMFAVQAGAEVKVSPKNGHYNAAIVRVTFRDGAVLKGILHSMGNSTLSWDQHQIAGTSLSGSAVYLWLDTIAKISETTDQDMLVTTKTGASRRIRYEGYHTHLHIVTASDNAEIVDLRQVSKVEFLKIARKDKLGNAMLDQWLYSPYTGERLRK